MRELVLKALNGCDQLDCANRNDASVSALPREFTRCVLRPNNFSLARNLNEMITNGKKFFSLEFFPQQRVDHMEILQSSLGACEPPLFCSVTWHVATPLTADLRDIPALKLSAALAEHGCMLHLAAAGLTEAQVCAVLQHALLRGITSVLLLRGDREEEQSRSSFSHTVDLVQFVRREFGCLFTVFVAGYPDGHPEATSYEQDLQYLKDKVDAGADGIITQVVFEARRFFSFVHDCRQVGISVPILPGIMPIVSYRCLEQASRVCRFNVPREITDAVRPIAENNEAVQEYGLCHATRLVRELFSLGCAHGVHFFTMNKPHLAIAIWQRVGLANTVPRLLLPSATTEDHATECLFS